MSYTIFVNNIENNNIACTNNCSDLGLFLYRPVLRGPKSLPKEERDKGESVKAGPSFEEKKSYIPNFDVKVN